MTKKITKNGGNVREGDINLNNSTRKLLKRLLEANEAQQEITEYLKYGNTNKDVVNDSHD